MLEALDIVGGTYKSISGLFQEIEEKEVAGKTRQERVDFGPLEPFPSTTKELLDNQ
jgi:hypothetical protein